MNIKLFQRNTARPVQINYSKLTYTALNRMYLRNLYQPQNLQILLMNLLRKSADQFMSRYLQSCVNKQDCCVVVIGLVIKSKRMALFIRDDHADQMRHFYYDLTLNNSKRTKKTSNIRQRAPKDNYNGYNYFLQLVFLLYVIREHQSLYDIKRTLLRSRNILGRQSTCTSSFPVRRAIQ